MINWKKTKVNKVLLVIFYSSVNIKKLIAALVAFFKRPETNEEIMILLAGFCSSP